MSLLPDDCWAAAFSFLPRCDQIRCSRVCRAFRKIVSAMARTPLLIVIGTAPKTATLTVWFLDESLRKWCDIPSLRLDRVPSPQYDRFFRVHSLDSHSVWFSIDEQQFHLVHGKGGDDGTLLLRWERRSAPLPAYTACVLNDQQMLFASMEQFNQVAVLSVVVDSSLSHTDTAVADIAADMVPRLVQPQLQHNVVARLSSDAYDLMPCGNGVYAFCEAHEVLCCDTKLQQQEDTSAAVALGHDGPDGGRDSEYSKWRLVWPSVGDVAPVRGVQPSYVFDWTHSRASDGQRYLYCSGGVKGTRCPSSQPSLYQFDTQQVQWKRCTPMYHDRVYHSLTWHGGRLFAIGGTRVRDDADCSYMNQRTPLSVVESYDAQGDVWREEVPLPGARTGHVSFSTTLL
eukprot:TRINITY_DN2798_c0_g1_i2.p1 TRINITY_DN2798_c0_g1~~TRINITY_DN2798_c0_g1_i2.p1  ORF type:complete len:399 (-),score=60.43 TRINITY_DN2798_c0_g1_i2:54-1250(-)